MGGEEGGEAGEGGGVRGGDWGVGRGGRSDVSKSRACTPVASIRNMKRQNRFKCS